MITFLIKNKSKEVGLRLICPQNFMIVGVFVWSGFDEEFDMADCKAFDD